MFAASKTKDLTPQQVKADLDAHAILLIDVREPAEFAAERIHGALNFPLSTFDPSVLPAAGDKLMVLQCGSGKRSATAIDRCQKVWPTPSIPIWPAAIMAWKAAGLPTVTLDSDTGSVRDRA